MGGKEERGESREGKQTNKRKKKKEGGKKKACVLAPKLPYLALSGQ
jgi:hypothetical protein